MRILVTGGAGFIGSNFIGYWLKSHPDDQVINFDKLTYAGSLASCKDFEDDPNYKFIKGDICDSKAVSKVMEGVDVVVHMAAESIPENIYIPIQSTRGTREITFGELWKEQLKNNQFQKTKNGEVIILKGKQTKALSFLNGGQWMPIKAITRHFYKGKIIKLKQKWGIIEATPNHSIYSANLKLTSPETNPELLVLREINERKKRYKKVNKNVLKILACYITEGNATFNKANGSYIVEISQGDKSFLQDIGKAIKKEFGLNSWIISHKKNSYKNVYGLQISNKKFFTYLVKNCGKYSDKKYFPNWIFDLGPKLRDFFWQKLLLGDGTKDGRYSTTSYKLANQLSLLLALQKKQFKVFEYDRGNYKRSWEFKTLLSGHHYGLNQKSKIEITYEGWVYDLEIDNTHNFCCGIGNVVCHNTHVDRSILKPADFIQTNVVGTQVLLDAALEAKVKRFHHVSTDEIFGALELDSKEKFTEESPYRPRSPYAASKAAADHLVRAYFATYNLPVTISNCSNNFGPFQFPEKIIPLFITNVLEGKKVPLYGDGLYVRDWIYVEDHCAGIELVLEKGKIGETYLIGAENEISNLDLAKKILKILGKDESQIEFVKDRPGHDRRYAINPAKIKAELGFAPKFDFEEALTLTVEWYKENREWWQKIKTGEYLEYYEKQYGKKTHN